MLTVKHFTNANICFCSFVIKCVTIKYEQVQNQFQAKKKKKINKTIKKSWFYIKHTDVSSLRFQSRTTAQGLGLCLGL